MIPKQCKRLAEVDFPIAPVSRYARAEKDSRIAHIPRLHVWPAARPGGACRSILLAMLLPDPCDPHCPQGFKEAARKALGKLPSGPARWRDELKTDEGLRKVLLEFIGELANWDTAGHRPSVQCAEELIHAAHGETPVVVDPFAGGGVIPLEALRLGCESLSSDLNPVACMIQQTVVYDLPRVADRIVEDLPALGESFRGELEKKLRDYYPIDPDGRIPVAYLWSRTVVCEQPDCGCEFPLRPSFWLSERPKRRRALRYTVRPGTDRPFLEWEITEPKTTADVQRGTASRGKATCPACGKTLMPARVRAQLISQRGGADPQFERNDRAVRNGGAQLLAVATLDAGDTMRQYRTATIQDYKAVRHAMSRREVLEREFVRDGVSRIPTEPFPVMSGTFNAPLYGMTRWCDMFTSRQLVAIDAMCELVRGHVPEEYQDMVALLIGKVIDLNNALTVWHTKGERPAHMLSRWAIPMKWDFPEAVPISEVSGSLVPAIQRTMAYLRQYGIRNRGGAVTLSDARHVPYPDESVDVWFTDPPYYNAIPYADLSDFFFVWLKRSHPTHRFVQAALDEHGLAPKADELCEMAGWDSRRYGHKDAGYFEDGMREAFSEGRRVLREDGIGSVVFAHKTTEGWEALLSGMIRGGWTITGSWPLVTEMSSRLRARDSAALATSVHLICRPRPEDAPVGDWGEVLRELPRRVADWMDRLQEEGVRGADLVFACIGPALEIFSRYSKVETADGRDVALPDYLEKVWEVVGRIALNQVLGTAEGRARNGAAGALEEDARLTALFLWTMQATEIEARNGNGTNDDEDDESDEDDEEANGGRTSKGKGFSLIFDVARRFAQPLGIHLEAWEDRVIKTEKGVVRLIPVLDRGKQLFGEEGASAIADRLERSPATAAAAQMVLFPEPAAAPKVKGRGRRKKSDATDADFETRREATTLDRVHAAMLLQASGRANALRALLKAEIDRGPEFLRLANALSALYPQGSDEKRLLDAMLLAVPR